MYIVFDARYPDDSALVALATEDRNEALRCAIEFGGGTKVVKLENGIETLDYEVGIDELQIFSSEWLHIAYQPLAGGKIHYLVFEPSEKLEETADAPSRLYRSRAEAIKIADQIEPGATVCELADGVRQAIYVCIFNDDYSEKYEDEFWDKTKDDYRWLTFRDK